MANKLVKHILDKIVTKLKTQSSPALSPIPDTTIATKSIDDMDGLVNAVQVGLSSSRCVDDIKIYKHNRISESKNISGLINNAKTNFKEEHTTPYEKRFVFEVDVNWAVSQTEGADDIYSIIEYINNTLLGYDVIADIIKTDATLLEDYTVIERTSLIPSRDERVSYNITNTHAKYKVFFKLQCKMLHKEISGENEDGIVDEIEFELDSKNLKASIFRTKGSTMVNKIQVTYTYIDSKGELQTAVDDLTFTTDSNSNIISDEVRLKNSGLVKIISVVDFTDVANTYTENIDYTLIDAKVDKASSSIVRIKTGSIASDGDVVVNFSYIDTSVNPQVTEIDNDAITFDSDNESVLTKFNEKLNVQAKNLIITSVTDVVGSTTYKEGIDYLINDTITNRNITLES